jgi:hypothetical protein
VLTCQTPQVLTVLMHVSLHLHSSAGPSPTVEWDSATRGHSTTSLTAQELDMLQNLTVGQLLGLNGTAPLSAAAAQIIFAQSVVRLYRARSLAPANAPNDAQAPVAAPTKPDGVIQDNFLRMGGSTNRIAEQNGQAFNQHYTLCKEDTPAFTCLLKHLFQILMGVVAFAAFLSACYSAWIWLD